MLSPRLRFLQPFLDHKILIGVPVPRNEDRQFTVLSEGTEVELCRTGAKLSPRVDNLDGRFAS